MKKVNWWIVLSLLLSIVACFISIFRVVDTYKLSDTSYISIIVTLMGICATFIVCYQIYTGITMHERIARLEKLEENIPNWEHLQYETEGNLELSKGFLLQSNNEFEKAFGCYQAALYNFLMADNKDKVEDTLQNLDVCSKECKKGGTLEHEDLISDFSDKVESANNYLRYKTKYGKIMNFLINKNI